MSCPWPCCFSFSPAHRAAHRAAPTGSRSLRVVSSPWPPSRPPASLLPPASAELLALDSLSQGQSPRPPSHQARPSGRHDIGEVPSPKPSLTAPSPSPLSHRPHPHPHLHRLSLPPCSSLILSYLVQCPDLWSQVSRRWPPHGLRGVLLPFLTPPLLTALPWPPSTHQEEPLPLAPLAGGPASSSLPR